MKKETRSRWSKREFKGNIFWTDEKELYLMGHTCPTGICPTDPTETFDIVSYETSKEKISAVAEMVKSRIQDGTKLLVAINEALNEARQMRIHLTEREYGDLVEMFPRYMELLDDMKRRGIA